MRLDEEKLEALRSWGERLRQTGGEESTAVGRAILMLIEEIDRLHIELWDVRLQVSRLAAAPRATAEDTEEPVEVTLQERLQRALDRDPDPFEAPSEPADGTGSGVENATETTSARSWIETLRRQK
jgi:hypothetical protein